MGGILEEKGRGEVSFEEKGAFRYGHLGFFPNILIFHIFPILLSMIPVLLDELFCFDDCCFNIKKDGCFFCVLPVQTSSNLTL